MKLHNTVALVTGGSGSIGAAVCRALAQDGAAVAVNYRSSELAAKELAAEIVAAGGRAITVGGDVSDHATAQYIVERVLNELGGLDILVNNAGITRNSLTYDMSESECWEVMRVNFGSVFNCTQAALQHFMSRGKGVIVNVSSVMGERAWIGQSNYSASKGAINAFTRCTALETARFGIRVNAILPGIAATALTGELAVGTSGRGILKQIPMRRFADHEQIARVVRFLAGPESEYITGALVNVDGGATALLGMGRPQ